MALALASGALSMLVHTGLIAAWVYATRPADGLPPLSVSNRVYFIPPPDRTPGSRPIGEVVHYIDLARAGPGFGDGPRSTGDAPPVLASETVGRAPVDSTPPAAAVAAPTQDSIFSILDVDTAVVRSANSAAPAYPLKLLQAHIMGSVSARYVVDTTGFADVETFRVLASTNPEFIEAVRDALPFMRFKPAKIGPAKVRQLVEQQFSFRIDTTLADVRKVKPLPRP